jgi:uncharacterized protein YneF (UPF0154 family)
MNWWAWLLVALAAVLAGLLVGGWLAWRSRPTDLAGMRLRDIL